MKACYAKRRGALLKQIGVQGIAIITAAPETSRGPDIEYLYRQSNHFYYLTGFEEPHSIIVLAPGRDEGEFILFTRPNDPQAEVWMGPRAGLKGAIKDYGANQAFPIDQFESMLNDLLRGREVVYASLTTNSTVLNPILASLKHLRSHARAGVAVPESVYHVDQLIWELRRVKDEEEIKLMRQAGKLSAAAHKKLMQVCRPGMMEYEFDAILRYEFRRHGCIGPAYPNIVGGGNRSTILHYNANNQMVKDGDMLLVDAGADYQYYAADITRTYPVNGKFSEPQRKVYEAVLAVQLKVIDMVRPDITYYDMQELARREITHQLVSIGLLQGDVEKLYQEKAYSRFYMHNIGHWLGMDVHDHSSGGYRRSSGEWIRFEPGMVITVEPGIYIAEGTEDVDKKWWGIGVRIEDDVLVTANGCEVLSADVPKTVADIEAVMAEGRK